MTALKTLLLLSALVHATAWITPSRPEISSRLGSEVLTKPTGADPPADVTTVWQEMWNRFAMTELPGLSNKCQIFEAQQKDPKTGKPFGPTAIVKISKLHDLMRLEADNYNHLGKSDLFVKVYEYHPPRTDDDVSVIIMERGHIDCRNYLKDNGAMTGSALHDVAKAGAETLLHMHEKQRVWTEMKSQNFIFTHAGEVKAIDFESAIPVGCNNILHTAQYAPPEFALEHMRGCNMAMDTTYDMWSYGMFLYEIATGALYFHEKGFDQADSDGIFNSLQSSTQLDLSTLDSLDPLLADLVKKCLSFDPKYRLTSQEAVKHPFFTNYKAPV